MFEMTATTAAAPAPPADQRLELARSVLRGVQLSSAEQIRSDGADARSLPVAEPLRPLLPWGALRRGSTVAVRGSTSLLLAVLAEASAGGAWSAVVGLPGLGLVAAAEAGVRLERLALVPSPGADLVAVAAALLDGLDLVAVAGVDRLGAAQRQRLMARARTRGSVLLPVGRWPGADVELSCTGGRWHGLVAGAGRLRARRAQLESRGRGSAGRVRVATLLLPLDAEPLGTEPVDTGPGVDVRRRAG